MPDITQGEIDAWNRENQQRQDIEFKKLKESFENISLDDVLEKIKSEDAKEKEMFKNGIYKVEQSK